MRTWFVFFTLLGFLFLSCTPKNGSKTIVQEKDDEDISTPIKEEIPEKGPPPPLPAWAKFPKRGTNEMEVKSTVQTLSILVKPDVRVKVRPPYKVFQTDALREEGGNVMMPVRVSRSNFEIVGLVDMYQVDVAVPGGTFIYDAPKGVEVGFISSPIRVQVKEVKDDWALISHELNSDCSPNFLKVWIKKSAIMVQTQGVVPFPAKYDKGAPKKELRKDAALFEVFGTTKSETSLIQLPMCNQEGQVLMTGKTSGNRTEIFFKPTPTGPFAVLGWMDKEIASGKLYSTCTCGNTTNSTTSTKIPDLQYDYKVRIRLPLYLAPDKQTEPVGAVEMGQVKRVSKYFKNPEFGRLEIEEGLGVEFFVPYHENYYEP